MQWKQRTDTDNNLWLKVMGCNWLFVTWSCIPTLSLARSLPAVDHNQDRHLIEDATLTATKGAITSKIKHVIKLKTSAARLAQCAVIGCKLKQNANEGCNSCASLAARFKFYCMFLFYLWSLLNGPITKLFPDYTTGKKLLHKNRALNIDQFISQLHKHDFMWREFIRPQSTPLLILLLPFLPRVYPVFCIP